MAQDGSETSVASSSPTPNWWELNANPLPWNATMAPWQHPSSTNSSGEEDMISASFTNADSSSADISGEPTDNNLWTQVLLSSGGVGQDLQLQSSHDHGGHFLEVLSSKTLARPEMFDPTSCSDYLKKLESNWEMPPTFNTLGRHELNCYDNGGSRLIEQERLTNLVSNWSIAPPNPNLDDHNISLPSAAPFMAQYMPYMHDIKGENHHREMATSETSLLRGPFDGNGIGYRIGLRNDNQWSDTKNMSDLISFNACLNKPALGSRNSRVSLKISDLLDDKKTQGFGSTSSSTRGSGRSSGAISEGKNKRSEDSSNSTLFKKSKHDSPAVSSPKLQAPKVKLADRITALQQIVSPFGKTDTASVLLEAINYVRFLQEQIQLLSDPYMKSSANKDLNSWGGLERKQKVEADLRSRGLCLVPVSCTPQVYRENTGPDYWTPTYRGYLYR